MKKKLKKLLNQDTAPDLWEGIKQEAENTPQALSASTPKPAFYRHTAFKIASPAAALCIVIAAAILVNSAGWRWRTPEDSAGGPKLQALGSTDGAASERELDVNLEAPQETNDVAGEQAAAPPKSNSGAAGATSKSMQNNATGNTAQAPGTVAPKYNTIEETGFLSPIQHPTSSFSADVDTAAYAQIRRMINSGTSIPTDAVRIEEMINYFSYSYAEPKTGEAVSINTELSDCPWATGHKLLQIGLKSPSINTSAVPSNLVFLIDVSGSMFSDDKLPLVKRAFSCLIESLKPTDRVSIVTYASGTQVVLSGANGSEQRKILTAVDGLSAGGSTNGAGGIQLAYEQAQKYFLKGGNNRVILATDGDFNVGVSSESELVKLIQAKRDTGVYLSVLGFGTGNFQDGKMEQLANNGNGNFAYIDSIFEANKVLIRELGANLYTVAKDVKIQVAFSADAVLKYRLIGYENRAMSAAEFDDVKKDAGEMGSGHTVTALYEIIPTNAQADFGKITVRYKRPTTDESREISANLLKTLYKPTMSNNMILASSVAEFGLILRKSKYRSNASIASVINRIQPLATADSGGLIKEFAQLAAKVKGNY